MKKQMTFGKDKSPTLHQQELKRLDIDIYKAKKKSKSQFMNGS